MLSFRKATLKRWRFSFIYGYLRLEHSGKIVYAWDTYVVCCIPTGDVSGQLILAGSGFAMLVMI